MTMYSLKTRREPTSRSFYHLAAALAHPESEALEHSNLLDPDYQDCLLNFKAQSIRLKNKFNKTYSINILNKYIKSEQEFIYNNIDLNFNNINILTNFLEQPAYNLSHKGINFSTEEISALVLWATSSFRLEKNQNTMNAQEFHDELNNLVRDSRQGSFCIHTRNFYLIEKVNLFSANRLNKKSWQIDNGAHSGMRYYHAALFGPRAGQIDILYWLKFDENHNIISSDFINNINIYKLTNLIIELKNWSLMQENSYAIIIRQIINLYLASLGIA